MPCFGEKKAIAAFQPPTMQPDAFLDQVLPIINNWYTILDTTAHVRIINLMVRIQTMGETLEVRITADGQVLTGSFAAIAGTRYLIVNAVRDTVDLRNEVDGTLPQRDKLFEAESIKVEVRKTTANGPGNLQGRVRYATLTAETCPTLQPYAILNQAAPAQNIWYTVLDTTENVQIIHIASMVELANERVIGRLTIDGRIMMIDLLGNHAFGTWYAAADYQDITAGAARQIAWTTNNPAYESRSILFEGRSVKFEIRKTTANGAGNLHCIIMYGTW